jgi:hypothetical protein
VGEEVPVRITGKVGDRFFAGEDTIRTIRPHLVHPAGGEHFLSLTTLPVQWEIPAGWGADTADVLYSLDDGESWDVVILGTENDGEVLWEIPPEAHGDSRIMVTLYREGEDIGSAMSGSFLIALNPVSVAVTEVERTVEESAAVLRWSTPALFDDLQGFTVLRADGPDGGYRLLPHGLARPASSDEMLNFEYRDEGIRANVEYRYLLVEQWAEGEGATHGPYELTYEVPNSLGQNFPNAFNPRTTIRFSIAQDGPVKLVVYDLRGRVVKTLLDARLRAEHYQVTWEGRDGRGAEVASGTYFYRLSTPGFTAARKMLLLR